MVLASAVLIGALAGCLQLAPFGKSPSAVSPLVPVSGFATVSQCPSFAAYQQEADPVFQRLCISCHAAGGPGASYFLLVSGQSSDNGVASTNFFVARNEAVPTDGSTTVDPTNPDGTSPLLERLNGGLTHSLTLSLIGDDYAAIRDWVTQEIANTCTIDPITGTVTVATPSPTPTD